MKKVITACVLLSVAAAGWAQGQTGGQRASGKTYPYSGGGIRGVADEAPDGFLVSPSEAVEFGGEAGFNEVPALRPRSLVPLIDVLKPEPIPDLKVKAPFAISVQFRGQSDAPVDPSSFRVLYGATKVDITKRFTQFATITAGGFNLDSARLPPGKHRLILQVLDSKQRMAERELRIEVE